MDASSPTEATSATQRAYRQIRRMVLTGAIPPGSRLKIDALSARLETGATPIREALSLLTSDQLVERIDQRGFRAAAVGKAQFEDILAVRCTFEEMALRQSMARRTPEWEERLVLSLHRLTRLPHADAEATESHHKAFHAALLDNCGSPLLIKFCDQLYDLNIRYRYLAARAASYEARDVDREHAEILAAVLDRDANLAADRLIGHYRITGRFLSDWLA